MPHMECCAERSTRIACGRLDKNVLPAAAAFEGLHQQSVKEQSSGQAQILALARHGRYRIFDRALQPLSDRGSQACGNRSSVVEFQALEKLSAEAAARAAVPVEEGGVEAAGSARDFMEQPVEAVVARG